MMKKPALKLIIALFLILIIATAIWLKIAQKQNLSLPLLNPSENQPLVLVAFNPQNSTISKNEELTIQVIIQTSINVVGVDLEFEFDPKFFLVKKIKPGNFFAEPQEIQKIIDNKKGKISYSFASLSPQSGNNILVELIFQPKSTGETIISLTDKTQVAAAETNPVKISELPVSSQYIIMK